MIDEPFVYFQVCRFSADFAFWLPDNPPNGGAVLRGSHAEQPRIEPKGMLLAQMNGKAQHDAFVKVSRVDMATRLWLMHRWLVRASLDELEL